MNKIIIASIFIAAIGIMSYFLYWYNYTEAKDTMSLVMHGNILVYAAVYINGTLIANGTAFNSPLINDDKFDACLYRYSSELVISLDDLPYQQAQRYISMGLVSLDNLTSEEICVDEQLHYISP